MGSVGTSADEVVDNLIRKHIEELSNDPYGSQSDHPFFVADGSRIVEQHLRWKSSLPDIQPFYAVKCNSDVNFLRYLDRLGVNFDCASQGEIELILSLGVDPSRIIFAHPCKSISALHFAAKQGIRWATFDNIDELEKVKQHSPQIGLLLRIFAEDDGAKVCLGDKFGAPWNTTIALLERARQLDLQIVGVSFHIGSGASDPDSFTTAIQQARRVFDQGERLGFDMTVLDVGGGFQHTNFEFMASSLRSALAREFGDRPVGVIAEPGRFYATPCYTLVCKVIARRTHIGAAPSNPADMVYQNDGLYGCFSCGWSEGEEYTPVLVKQNEGRDDHRESGEHRYSLWGPTCDSIDRIAKGVVMDGEVKVGDWLVYKDMGAYTMSASSRFNGFPNSYTVIYQDF
ncbi:Type III Pyridoxal 5-phosphate PLP-Dependent Enzyme Ornithine Decarboxylase [Aspergillus parasiticus SU-1]|uniref:ornithine decarboxylase n=1 Tax=Aspergillus parasiticus (strain ATCC 56775 / NRRL 5862 / SRRC 143 / SU-1) TaxID=1403190 RepID=A0A0F0HYX1_ASPPU|nr:Type III Pyridoxal 5-phosphate PLP-Dependent Enzyme Ornithine Decarboxylase [Aspergillus parasiticus SU-1]